MWIRFGIILLYIILSTEPVDMPDGPIAIEENYEMRKGAKVELTAIPLEGFVFSYWSSEGEILSDSITYSFTMPDHDFSITANFLREE